MGKYEPRQPKWQWREYLTDAERETLRLADEAKAKWLALNRERAGITNRAIQRAKFAGRTALASEGGDRT